MPATQQKDGTWRIKKKDGTLGTRKFTSKKNALAAQRSGGAKKKPGKKVAKRGTAATTTPAGPPGTGRSYQAVRLTALALSQATDAGIAIVAQGKDPEEAGRFLIEAAVKRPHLTHLAVVAVDVVIDKSRRVGQAAALSRGSVTAWAPEVYSTGMIALDALGNKEIRAIHTDAVARVTGYDPWRRIYRWRRARTYRALKHGGQLVRIGASRIKVLRRLKRVVQENILRPVGATL